MRRSQVSHVFIFALGIIIVALTLFFGYKVVQELRAKGEDTALIRFKTKLVNDIKILKEGDVELKSYIIPRGYREVCFVDDEAGVGPHWCSELHKTCTDFSTNEPELDNAIKSELKENVFLVGESKTDSIFIGNIDLGNGPDFQDPPFDAYYSVYCFEIKNSNT